MKREELIKLIPNYSRVKYGNAGTYIVADIDERFGVIFVGIYDEPPSSHVDYLNGENVENADEFLASHPEEQTVEEGVVCKDKNIEQYALKNYGRLSHMSTIGIIITALSEYASQSQSLPSVYVDYEGLCDNLNTYMAKNKMTVDFLKELFKGYVEQSQLLPSVTRQYPAKCSTCNGTGSDLSRIDMMNTSSICIVCNGNGVITVTECFKSQLKPECNGDCENCDNEQTP